MSQVRKCQKSRTEPGPLEEARLYYVLHPLGSYTYTHTLTRMSLNKEHAVSAEEAVIIPIEVIQQPTHSW